ncbi:MAG: hypothetical protein DWQ35_07865, partial [Planctomycetota bacterium]
MPVILALLRWPSKGQIVPSRKLSSNCAGLLACLWSAGHNGRCSASCLDTNRDSKSTATRQEPPRLSRRDHLMNDDAATLEARLRDGDAAALGPYLSEVRPQLLAFVERQLGSQLRRKVEAEDILQETGIEAVRQYEKRPDRDQKPFSWLCQIAER